MPSTKIINVQKGDSFAEIFEVFQHADAKEVILIFPKGSRFARDERQLAAFKAAAEQKGQSISVLSADPAIAELAASQGMAVLGGQRPSAAVSQPHKLKVTADDEPEPVAEVDYDSDQTESEKREEDEPEHIAEDDGLTALPVATLAAARSKPDIVKVWNRMTDLPKAKPKRHRPVSRWVALAAGAGLLILFLLLYNSLAKAEITVRPKQQTADYQFKAAASANVAIVDTDFNKLPGQLLNAQADANGAYSATGYKNVVQKASGHITIYNQSGSDQRLVATTRFATASGLVFRIPATVVVPAKGQLESAVYADRPGPEYNITASRFTLPGLKGGPKYDQFYAVSSAPMSGGLVGPAKVITDSDYAKAHNELQAATKDKVLKALRDQASGLTVLADTTVMLTDSANAKSGEAADALQLTVTGSAQTIAFRAEDAAALAQNYLKQNGGWTIIPGQTQITYQSPRLDNLTKTLNFTVQISGPVAKALQPGKLRQAVLGLDEAAIRQYFKDIPEVESAKVILSPFWVRKIPTDPAKINIKLELD